MITLARAEASGEPAEVAMNESERNVAWVGMKGEGSRETGTELKRRSSWYSARMGGEFEVAFYIFFQAILEIDSIGFFTLVVALLYFAFVAGVITVAIPFSFSTSSFSLCFGTKESRRFG